MPPTKRPQSPVWYSDFTGPDLKNPGSLRRYRLSLGVSGSLREAVAAEKELIKKIDREAEALAEAAEKAKASAAASADAPHAAFSGFTAFWLDNFVRTSCKPSTYGLYESMCRIWLVPWFGDRELASITALDVQKFVSWASEQPKRSSRAADAASRPARSGPAPSAKYLNCLVGCLSSMLNRAIKWKYIRENPCNDVERLHEEEVEMDYYSHAEIDVWLAKCIELEPRWHPLFLLLLRAGLRLGELRALRQLEDLDFVGRQIHVRRSITRGMVRDPATGARDRRDVETDPKGRRSRIVGMAPSLVHVLREARHLRGPLLFCQEDGAPLKRRQILAVWERVTRASGLRLIRLHDMRHTFASGLAARGVPLEGIRKLLGHASDRTTRRYAHLSPQQAASYVDLLDEPESDALSGTLPGGAESSSRNDSGKVVRGTRFELARRRGDGGR